MKILIEILIAAFIVFIWYICALIFIACKLWQHDCKAYTKLGYWICKIATFGIKK